MANFIDDFVKSLGPEVSKQLSSNLGIDKNVAAQIIPQVAPLILGGLKRQMETSGGADRANHILDKYGSADVLDNIGATLKAKSSEDNPDPQLGGLLGQAGLQGVNTIAKQFKLDKNVAMKIIPMLAPIVLGALTQKRDQGGVGLNGIAALIDQDGDGNILDDVSGFLMKGLAGDVFSQKSKGALGNLLGGFLGKRR